MDKLYFASDYQEGAHPAILQRLTETNLEKSEGYGTDAFCASAREKIRRACRCPEAEVRFLVGGTQTNATVIGSLLRSYQGVLAAETGHISTHEAGAIEFGGHKVLTLPHQFGKISADDLRDYCRSFWSNGNHDHMVMPGMVYLSQPTEYGTLYSRAELEAIRQVCDDYRLALYVDGARLAYALACRENDVSLSDLARLCDVFYIGGTKCGALFGEAVVIPDPGLIPHFFTIVKQHGALLAKGRLLGLQFDTLFTDDLYLQIGRNAIAAADAIREALRAMGCSLAFPAPTNQVFLCLEDGALARLDEQVVYSFWEKPDEGHTVIRLASSWATNAGETDQLIRVLTQIISAP